MYNFTKSLALGLMKAPAAPPESPLGTHSEVHVFRASPKYLTYRLLGFWMIVAACVATVGVLLLVGMTQDDRGMDVLIAITGPALAVILFCVYFTIRIDYDMRYYIVTDRSLRVREGAVVVKEMTVSYANIQNIRVVQGPLLRLFGILHLQVDTAGGGGSEAGQHGNNMHRVTLAGITNAREVRDLILEHLRHAGSGLGDLDDRPDTERSQTSLNPTLLSALRDLKTATAKLRTTAED